MKNKKILSAISAVLAVVILAGGALAFFTAEAATSVNTKVGNVEVSVIANLTHTQLKREYLAQMEYYGANSASTIAGEATIPELDSTMFDTAPNNINPGDNDYSDWENQNEPMPRPGTDHELEITISNDGSKSVAARVLVEIINKGTTSQAAYLPTPLMENIFVALDMANTISGTTSLHMFGFDNTLLELPTMPIVPDTEKGTTTENAVCYAITPEILKELTSSSEYAYILEYINKYSEANELPEVLKAGLILSGNPEKENAEAEKYATQVLVTTPAEGEEGTEGEEGLNSQSTAPPETEIQLFECPTEGTFKLDLGMLFDKYGDAEALEGADLEIIVTVQAMQYRNTSEATWETVFEEKFPVSG